MDALSLYSAGLVATLVVSRLVESRWPRHQRAPLSAQCGLALLWPLYLAFLTAVLCLRERDRA
jgi:hypothetical protein